MTKEPGSPCRPNSTCVKSFPGSYGSTAGTPWLLCSSYLPSARSHQNESLLCRPNCNMRELHYTLRSQSTSVRHERTSRRILARLVRAAAGLLLRPKRHSRMLLDCFWFNRRHSISFGSLAVWDECEWVVWVSWGRFNSLGLKRKAPLLTHSQTGHLPNTARRSEWVWIPIIPIMHLIEDRILTCGIG